MSEKDERPQDEEVAETTLEQDETPELEGHKWHSPEKAHEPDRAYKAY